MYIVLVLKVERYLMECSFDEVFFFYIYANLSVTVNWAKCVHEIIQKNLLDECNYLSTYAFYIDGFSYIYLQNIPRKSCFSLYSMQTTRFPYRPLEYLCLHKYMNIYIYTICKHFYIINKTWYLKLKSVITINLLFMCTFCKRALSD